MTARWKARTLKTQTSEKKKPVPLKTWLKWQAPVRPFKKRDREYYTTIGAIVILLGVILLFLKEWLLIAVIVSAAFVAYVLATVEPEKVEHEITSRGVVTGGRTFNWDDLRRFWFTKKWHDEILNIDTRLSFPARLMLLAGKGDKAKIKKLLEKKIQYEVPAETFLDRSAKWLAEKVPLEKEE
jgi:hypothetical protein